MLEKIFNILPYIGAALIGLAQGTLIGGACFLLFLLLKVAIYLLGKCV